MPSSGRPAPLVRGPGVNDPYIGQSSPFHGSPPHGRWPDHQSRELWCALLSGVVQVNWEVVEMKRCLLRRDQWLLIFIAILCVDLVSGLCGQWAMNLVLPFNTNIGLTWELSGSLRQPSAIVTSDAVEFPHMLPSTPSYSMTPNQAPIRPSSPAELDTERGRLDIWLFTIEGALVFDLCSVSWRSKMFGEVGVCIFRAPECFVFGWPAVYAFSFWLPSFIELWRDPGRWSAFIILVQLWLVGLQCFRRLRYGWSDVAIPAALLRWISWLPLLLLWLLQLWLFAVRLDFWIGGAVEKLFHTVQSSILWGQRLDLGHKSWS